MKEYMLLLALIGIIAITVIYKHMPSKFTIPEGFDLSGNRKDVSGTDISGEFWSATVTPPFATPPIDNLDDYEHTLVFTNENDREMTKATRDILMSKYPMDWSVQPSSSDIFAQGLAEFKAKEGFTSEKNQGLASPYTVINGNTFLPPDLLKAEMSERDILNTYAPKNPKSLTTYDAADAKELVDKIYAAKGQVADMKETGKNVFTIVNVRPAAEKPIFEDDPALTSGTAVASAGENTIVVPTMVSTHLTTGLDPFFTPSDATRDGKWDYTAWSPGLERTFAPNLPMKQWY